MCRPQLSVPQPLPEHRRHINVPMASLGRFHQSLEKWYLATTLLDFVKRALLA